MLIVEGPDLAGKTTFCNALLKEINDKHGLAHVYRHLSRLPEQFDPYWGHMALAATNIVQDRFHMSEVAYGYAARHYSKVLPETYHLLDGALRMFGAFHVVITVDPGLLRTRRQTCAREEMFDEATVMQVNNIFASFAVSHSYTGSYTSPSMNGTPSMLTYYADVDVAIYCNAQKPYPTHEDVSDVVSKYLSRVYEIYRQARGPMTPVLVR